MKLELANYLKNYFNELKLLNIFFKNITLKYTNKILG